MAKMKLFYSGNEGHASAPECILEKPDVMISFWEFHNKKPNKRIRKIIKQNKKKKGSK